MVVRPNGCRVIKNRWVFDVKPDGRKRARLVAKGFSQVEGKDFDQIFSPVVQFETVRLILALAVLEGWFLYGELEEEIYMEQPEGFHARGKERHVLQLHRALHWGQGPKYPPGTCWIHWEYRQRVTPMCPVGKSWVY